MAIKRNIGEVSRNKRKKRNVKPLILIISEGKDTEVNYFKNFNQTYINVDVKPVDKNSMGKNKSRKTNPVNLVERAIYYINNKYDIDESDGDRVWCIMDVDLNYNNPNPIESRVEEFKNALDIADKYTNTKKDTEKIHIRFGLSNPCFEIWYLLHFKYTSGYLKDYDSVKSKLIKDTPIKNYDKTISIYPTLHDKTSTALRNSKKLRNYYLDDTNDLSIVNTNNIKTIIESNPYTNIDILVSYIEKLNSKK